MNEHVFCVWKKEAFFYFFLAIDKIVFTQVILGQNRAKVFLRAGRFGGGFSKNKQPLRLDETGHKS